MVFRDERLQTQLGGLYNRYDIAEGVGTGGTSFINVLTIDSTAIRESVFVIHNNGAGDVDFEILGNPRHKDDIIPPTGTDDDDKGWVPLTNGTGSIATGDPPLQQALTNPWTQIVIRIKHTSLATTVDIWHRGEN